MLSFLRHVVLGLGLFATVFSAHPATKYVSGSVLVSGNGNSWLTAWKSPANINWSSIAPGDTIYLDGGLLGMSYGAFSTITASGTSNNYITIARSTELGRDGMVTIATPCVISGSYIKFDGGGYKPVVGDGYRCGIVFTCSTRAFAGSISGGASVAATGQRPWFRYCYFNGTYEAPTGHSFGANNSTGFVLDHCWFYQASWEDQWIYTATAGGGSVAITNTVFQDNNKPNRTDSEHRDVANPFQGTGGWNLYVVGSIFFNTPGHASDQPQGDELLLQVGWNGSTTVPLNDVIAINNICYNALRFIAIGTQNSGVNRFIAYNNTVRSVSGGDEVGLSVVSPALSPTKANNISKNSNPGFVNATSPLGADGIPFTADDGFNITSGSSAINAGANIGVPIDIRNLARMGNPDLGAYEFGAYAPALRLTIRLTATNTVAVSWPSASAGYSLQQNTNIAGPNWTAVTTPPTDNGTTKTVVINPPVGTRFYRLFRP